MNNTKRIKSILKKLKAQNIKLIVKQSHRTPSACSVGILFYHLVCFKGDIDSLNNMVLKGILAHELVHINKNDMFIAIILPIFLITASLVLFLISHICGYLLFLFAILIIYLLLAMYTERRADLLAAKAVGKYTIINSITVLDKLGLKSKWPHGSLEHRIKRIKNIKL